MKPQSLSLQVSFISTLSSGERVKVVGEWDEESGMPRILRIVGEVAPAFVRMGSWYPVELLDPEDHEAMLSHIKKVVESWKQYEEEAALDIKERE